MKENLVAQAGGAGRRVYAGWHGRTASSRLFFFMQTFRGFQVCLGILETWQVKK